MSKFDELKKRAEHAKEEFLFMGLKPEEVLEVLAIQAQLVAALKGLDESFCAVDELNTKEGRHQARMNLIAARAAVAAAEVKP